MAKKSKEEFERDMTGWDPNTPDKNFLNYILECDDREEFQDIGRRLEEGVHLCCSPEQRRQIAYQSQRNKKLLPSRKEYIPFIGVQLYRARTSKVLESGYSQIHDLEIWIRDKTAEQLTGFSQYMIMPGLVIGAVSLYAAISYFT